MFNKAYMRSKICLCAGLLISCLILPQFQSKAFAGELIAPNNKDLGMNLLLSFALFILIVVTYWLIKVTGELKKESRSSNQVNGPLTEIQISNLELSEIDKLTNRKKKPTNHSIGGQKTTIIIAGLMLCTLCGYAQDVPVNKQNALSSPGITIMLFLVVLPIIGTVILICLKLSQLIKKVRYKRLKKDAQDLSALVDFDENVLTSLMERKNALEFSLTNQELSGETPAKDKKGILQNIEEVNTTRFFASKTKAAPKHTIDPALTRLILWYLATATFWLVLGTSIGEYLGIKFVSPDVDHVSWLSFGRLRPVHTNMVFWGWSSLAMIGLGHYVVTTVSNTILYSIKKGYQALLLINAAILSGSFSLMAGVNNGGGEYREYIWPVMLLFALGIIITLYNFIRTIATRNILEIYISNWYIIAALMFLVVIALVGYLPWWQNGLGETIVQGYYMHQAVGMWFMLFNLGLIYYFLPQQLNTPIYSYSLGILAFWSQILFYTLIGTHHFIFSSIPWWLQTIAIVGSMGMLIPVISGTTNFLMTFKGSFHKIGRSYTLPFYLTGIIFYFTGSTQGTAEAFRATNLVWHFTDFTIAHSHITMYGIIAFMLWASIYTLVPRLTGKEPRQGLVGAHFWMALTGILFYSIPLMIGGTFKGILWGEGKPFIDGVVLMSHYWLWRAIGGSLMLASHFIFAWNMYAMTRLETDAELRTKIMAEILKAQGNIPATTL
jgi:cytochrome c oxidase cbb3-type subunit 1